MNNTQNSIAACAVALSLGILSWHFIERPSLNLKRLFLRQRHISQ